jgi:RES domain
VARGPAYCEGAHPLDDDGVVDLEDLTVRRMLEERHAPLLAAYGVRHLDISQLRSRQRIVTQTIGLELFAAGIGGIRYKSTLDDGECVALFEGCVELRPYGAEQEISADDEDLVTIARQWKLDIEP